MFVHRGYGLNATTQQDDWELLTSSISIIIWCVMVIVCDGYYVWWLLCVMVIMWDGYYVWWLLCVMVIMCDGYYVWWLLCVMVIMCDGY